VDSWHCRVRIVNIAHFFTLLRIFISPIFPLLYLQYEWLGIPFVYVPYLILGFILICECSDLFDGFLARRHNLVSDLGKILDPVADTVTHITLFITFTQGIVQLPLFFVFVFLYRELFIGALRTLCALRGEALAARMSGKIKAVLQASVCCAIIFLMIFHIEGFISLSVFQDACFYLAAFAALYTAISVADYVYANRMYIHSK
jgi:CDP-diacylglycerol--glycerol-3-phosphate 3-phosphatidyltransferase